MTAHPSYMYRDPMVVLMEKQAREARHSWVQECERGN